MFGVPKLVWSLLVILALCITEGNSQSQRKPGKGGVWQVQDYPDPRRNPASCGRMKMSMICDPNGIISETNANELERQITAVYNDTRCTCYECVGNSGYIIMVALMPKMKKIYDLSDSLGDRLIDARAYSYVVSEMWKFGKCGEDVLILFARDDNIIYTLTRPNAREKLTDSKVEQITLAANNYFLSDNKEHITDGLRQMINDYRSVFLGTYDQRTQPPPSAFKSRSTGAAAVTSLSGLLLVGMLLMSTML